MGNSAEEKENGKNKARVPTCTPLLLHAVVPNPKALTEAQKEGLTQAPTKSPTLPPKFSQRRHNNIKFQPRTWTSIDHNAMDSYL
jgi:hypothetical protein